VQDLRRQPQGIATGDRVTVSAGGTSVALRARVSKNLRTGVARVALEHSGGLLGTVEVAPADAGVTA